MTHRWVITLTAGAGCSQKYPPGVWVFNRKADAISFLRAKISKYIKDQWQTYNTWNRGHRPHHRTIKDFLQSNYIENFDTNEGEFWLDKIDSKELFNSTLHIEDSVSTNQTEGEN
jgi:hypothetical protein